MQGYLNNKSVDLVVLLNFKDINLFCNCQTIDNVLVHSGVCFNCSWGLFQLSNATINSNKHWSLLSVCSDHKILFILFWSLAMKPIVSVFSLLHWGSTQLTNKRDKKVCFLYSTNLWTYILYILFASFFTIKYDLLPSLSIQILSATCFKDLQASWLISRPKVPCGI